ncbi:hypothetical protein ABZ816_00525 [Actinosynnema sp. NPDC047251]|uniref:Uncharacterized protein n=1 Tax=Saccharothrix espanaensis (strain ATCC 51144 / DSM 44229 / JCM 9112 / NBRC 15066 / NRRL 15764) TaxID=1179773 RepID=K0JZL4_SACES|nr:hypothetical protein [Saccharothrix espanaensis]CCH30732.1 hypothetical protein BN6_34340 [Saccharothrix espanaensis DSM 44229]
MTIPPAADRGRRPEAGVRHSSRGGSAGGGSVPESYTDVLFSRIVQAAGVARDEYRLSAKLWLDDLPDTRPDPHLLAARPGALVGARRPGQWGQNPAAVDLAAAHGAEPRADAADPVARSEVANTFG